LAAFAPTSNKLYLMIFFILGSTKFYFSIHLKNYAISGIPTFSGSYSKNYLASARLFGEVKSNDANYTKNLASMPGSLF